MDYLSGLTSFEQGAMAAKKDLLAQTYKEHNANLPEQTNTNPYMDGLVVNPTNLDSDTLDTLETNEGFRDKIYTDSEGYLTIGIGHKLTKKEIEDGTWSGGISREGARKLAQVDLKREQSRLYTSAPELKYHKATPILEDMAFNMGGAFIDKWPKFKAQLLEGNYSAAADNILSSKYATQVGDRAKRNAEYLRALQ